MYVTKDILNGLTDRFTSLLTVQDGIALLQVGGNNTIPSKAPTSSVIFRHIENEGQWGYCTDSCAGKSIYFCPTNHYYVRILSYTNSPVVRIKLQEVIIH